MLTQMAKYLDTVYVSGWQCSSTASSTDEPSPDLADYPMVWLMIQLDRFLILKSVEYCPQQSPAALSGSAFPRPQTAGRADLDSQGKPWQSRKH